MTISARIDNILNQQGISRRQLAIKAGIPPTSFQSAMARGDGMSTKMLNKVADALGVPVQVLLTSDDIAQTSVNLAEQIGYYESCLDVAIKNPDTPSELKEFIQKNRPDLNSVKNTIYALSIQAMHANPEVEILLNAFDRLNEIGQQKAAERVEELTKIPEYQKTPKRD